jgi:hypothetical protein
VDDFDDAPPKRRAPGQRSLLRASMIRDTAQLHSRLSAAAAKTWWLDSERASLYQRMSFLI